MTARAGPDPRPRVFRYDVNISILFTDLPPLRRPAAAAAAGFEAVELWWPFATPTPSESEVERLVDSISGAGLTLACLNFDGGDFDRGERGLISSLATRSRFLDNVPVALEIARRLDCRVLNALYGNVRAEDRKRAAGIAAETLALAVGAARAVDPGIVVVLEALNAAEYPHYGLHTVDEAAAVAQSVAPEPGEAVGVLVDVYHAAGGGLDLAAAIRQHAALIRHVQIADSPGRGRPGTGSLDFAAVFEALGSTGYDGFVGLEYLASPDPADTFTWL